MTHPLPCSPSGLYLADRGDAVDQHSYAVEAIEVMAQTAFQTVCIARTATYGRALFLDGLVQSSAADEAMYHQLLVQPAMLAHPKPTRVLLVGSGEGAGLREVLAHAIVESAVMVDIDGELVELCRQHLPDWHEGAFDDPRTRVVIADADAFIATDPGVYDVIIVDLTDMLPEGPACGLYTPGFFSTLKQHLAPGGVMAVQGLGLSAIDHAGHVALAGMLRPLFKEVHSYGEFIPSFLQAWGFILASDWFSPRAWTARAIDMVISLRLPARPLLLDGAYLHARFALAPPITQALAAADPRHSAVPEAVG